MKTFKKQSYQVINEDLVNLASTIEAREEYDVKIKNLHALNSDDFDLNYLVIQVNRGDIKKLVDSITSVYNFSAEINDTQKTIIFKRN